jgi:hypothetical protein
MSWSPLMPPAGKATRGAQVSVSTTAPGGRYAPVMILVVRYAELEGFTLLEPDRRCDVMVGHGDHAGMLRLARGATFRVGRPTGGVRAKGIVMLRLPYPPGVPVARRPSQACEFDHGNDWLEVTLPAWVKPAAEPKAPDRAASAFTSITRRVPDPAAARRGVRA